MAIFILEFSKAQLNISRSNRYVAKFILNSTSTVYTVKFVKYVLKYIQAQINR